MSRLVTEVECLKVINNIYPKHRSKISIAKFEIEQFSEGSVGFLANHLKLKITAKLDIGPRVCSPKAISAFVKATPVILEHRQYVEEANVFQKEYNFFNRLAPLLCNISENWCPNCYLAKEDMLIFEDLAAKGYKDIHHSSLMVFAHLKISVETLANFHSSSLLLQQRSRNGKNCIIREEFNNCVFECIYVDDPCNAMYKWFENGVETMIKMTTAIDKYNQQEIIHIADRMPNILHRLKEMFKPSETKINVVCHGDLWVNNILFRYDDKGTPVACRLIDFQVIRFASAALDLACMLCLCSDKATTPKYEDKELKLMIEVIAVYEAALNEALFEYGTKSQNITEEVTSFKAAALMEACLYEMINRPNTKTIISTLSSSEGVQRFFFGDRSAVAVDNFVTDNNYRSRMNEFLEELVDDYILK